MVNIIRYNAVHIGVFDERVEIVESARSETSHESQELLRSSFTDARNGQL